MEKAYKEGKVCAIGLSNFKKEQIEEILSLCEVKPTILQTELHPYNQEPELKAFLRENGMAAQAWYPLGHGDRALREEPLFAKLGEKYGKTSTQIILRWHMQAGNVVIPGSKNPEHIKANFDLFDFELTADEMAQISAMNQNKRYLYQHSGAAEEVRGNGPSGRRAEVKRGTRFTTPLTRAHLSARHNAQIHTGIARWGFEPFTLLCLLCT